MKIYPTPQVKAFEALIEIRDIQAAMFKLAPRGIVSDVWISNMDPVDKQIFDLHLVKLGKALDTLKYYSTSEVRSFAKEGVHQ